MVRTILIYLIVYMLGVLSGGWCSYWAKRDVARKEYPHG